MNSNNYGLLYRRQIQLLTYEKTVFIIQLVPLADFGQSADIVVPFHTDSVKGFSILHDIAYCVSRDLYWLDSLSCCPSRCIPGSAGSRLLAAASCGGSVSASAGS